MRLSPEGEAAMRAEFGRLANMTQAELRAWLEAPQSREAGAARRRDRIGLPPHGGGHRRRRRHRRDPPKR